MCTKNYLAVLVAAAAWLSLAAAMPAEPRIMDLMDAVNSTTCPIKVTVDEDPTRIPRRIKVIKCAGDVGQWCESNGISQLECCNHNRFSEHHNYQMRCAEIHDTVLVYFPDAAGESKHKLHDVAVGCACVVERPLGASVAT